VTVYEYDNDGNVTAKSDALGNRTEHTYDNRHNELSETDALGNTTTLQCGSPGSAGDSAEGVEEVRIARATVAPSSKRSSRN
jgi:YD repeat-containing protein